MAFRVLVAGGAGLVGSAVARQLLSEGAEVAVVDAMGDQGDGRAVREERARELRAFPKATVVTADLSLPGAAGHEDSEGHSYSLGSGVGAGPSVSGGVASAFAFSVS